MWSTIISRTISSSYLRTTKTSGKRSSPSPWTRAAGRIPRAFPLAQSARAKGAVLQVLDLCRKFIYEFEGIRWSFDGVELAHVELPELDFLESHWLVDWGNSFVRVPFRGSKLVTVKLGGISPIFAKRFA